MPLKYINITQEKHTKFQIYRKVKGKKSIEKKVLNKKQS